MMKDIDTFNLFSESLSFLEKPEKQDELSSISSSCDSEKSILPFIPVINAIRFDDLAAKTVKTRFQREA